MSVKGGKSMAYLDYYEYLNLGGVCDEPTFNRNIDRVCGVIDNATFNRIHAMEEIPRNVKALCRDLVEFYVTNWNFNEKEIASYSESAGTVSESVSYVSKDNEKIKKEMDNIVLEYLGSLTNDNGIPLMYRGAVS